MLVWLVMTTGMRRAEVAGLRWLCGGQGTGHSQEHKDPPEQIAEYMPYGFFEPVQQYLDDALGA